MPLTFDRNRDDYHAVYDAALLNAALPVRPELIFAYVQSDKKFDINIAQNWRVPWCISPKVPVENQPAISDFISDTSGRLCAALQDRKMLKRTKQQPDDVRIFLDHWAHYLVRQSVGLHAQTTFQESLEGANTPESVEQSVRDAIVHLCNLGTGKGESIITADSPVHPHWKYFGAKDGESASRNYARLIIVSEKVRNLARKLAGNTIVDSVGCSIVREVVPELLSVNRDNIAEIECPERTVLQGLYMQMKDRELTAADYAELTLRFTELWLAVDPDTAGALALNQVIADETGQDVPNVEWGNIIEGLNQLILPFVKNPATVDELRRRLPLLKFLAMRSISDSNDELDVRAVISCLNKVYESCPVTDPMLELFKLTRDCAAQKSRLCHLRSSL